MVNGRPVAGRVLAAVAIVALQYGCSESTQEAKSAEQQSAKRDTRVVHEECNIDKPTEKDDVNGDGKPDITVVRNGSNECQAWDLNFDGVIDSWVYLAGGQVRRREADYDRDGLIDEISIYKGGAIAELHRATTPAGRLDTWEYYKGGRRVRAERDSDGDAQIDQWWEYPKADLPDCPLIHTDVDGDGRPDPGATVDVCGEFGDGYVPPDRENKADPTGPKFERAQPGDVPVEVDEKPMEEGDAPPPAKEDK